MGRRSTPDSTRTLWIEPGETRTGPVAIVVLEAPVDQSYAYLIPDELRSRVAAGQRVRVPTGRGGTIRTGFCIGIDHRPWDTTLRPLAGVIDEPAILTPELLDLGQWISSYYACPLGVTLAALVPAAARKGAGFRTVTCVRLTLSGQRALAERAAQLAVVNGEAQPAIEDRVWKGKAREEIDIQRLASLEGEAEPVAMTPWLRRIGASPGVVRRLAERGWIEKVAVRQRGTAPTFDLPQVEPGFEPNADQMSALNKIGQDLDRGGFSVTVVHGVAGSGKTEVYVRAVRLALAQGKQAILLVPEIMLTTQLVGRLAARFQRLAVLHSGLSERDRSLLWHEIASGRRSVVIGTRSAVFSPCPHLGLIVVDEEHENSYKNQRSPHYHARDVALKRAQMAGVPVVLGSATPSLESWLNSERLPHFRRVEMPTRVQNFPMPRVQIVDMEMETRDRQARVVLSRVLEGLIAKVLSRQEQAIILVNRRGYATWMFCPRCRLWLTCPNCSSNLVYHQPQGKLSCHYCRFQSEVPERCPDRTCGGPLVARGCGTQRLEAVLKAKWPAARVRRADSDTMRGRWDYQKVVDAFESREIDILIGTQMIAKGLDFPHVSLVGVIGAEATGVAGDFRAGERLFQLLTQVSGRAGRAGGGGQVVIQTMMPRSPVLEAAAAGRHDLFMEGELRIRRHCAYPPFKRLIRLIVRHRSRARAQQMAEDLVNEWRGIAAALGASPDDVSFPMPCAVERMAGEYRFEALVRAATSLDVESMLHHWREAEAHSVPQSALHLDVDPVSLS